MESIKSTGDGCVGAFTRFVHAKSRPEPNVVFCEPFEGNSMLQFLLNYVRHISIMLIIKALIALVGRLSLSAAEEMVLNGDLRLFHLTLNFLL